MSLGWSLLVWLAIFLAVYIVLRASRIATVPSLIFGLLIGYIFLIIFVPLTTGVESEGGWVFIYAIIMFLTPLFIILYLALLIVKYVPRVESRNPFKIVS